MKNWHCTSSPLFDSVRLCFGNYISAHWWRGTWELYLSFIQFINWDTSYVIRIFLLFSAICFTPQSPQSSTWSSGWFFVSSADVGSVSAWQLSLVGKAQLYQLSLVDAHTVAQNQYTGKNVTIFTYFVMALCYVQECELSYNVLGMTQNCIPPREIIILNGSVIRLGIGEGANVIFKQVSHTIR